MVQATSQKPSLIMTLPQGILTATSLGVEGLAWHRSPGSGKHFHGRHVYFELVADEEKPGFEFLEEGGWRNAKGDTIAALSAVKGGKRTKTAMSNFAFGCTPIDAYRRAFLVKTGGKVLELESRGVLANLDQGKCVESMTPDQVAAAAGLSLPGKREPRLYMVLAPVELLVLSNLTPEEYVWYATHRPGKVFRQVLFAEVQKGHDLMAAKSVYDEATSELAETPVKKTKTIVVGNCINEIPFNMWSGYGQQTEGGLWLGDQKRVALWRFPAKVPRAWENAEG